MLVGAAAALAAWLGMAGWAWLGVSLVGFGTVPAALALAVGGSARFGEGRVEGSISLMPLGISLVGAVLLATLLTTWRRVLGAAVTFLAGLVVLVLLPAGELAVDAGRTVLCGVLWLVVVLGARVATSWLPEVRRALLVVLWASGLAVVAGALASIAGGARMLGTMLLGGPNLLAIAVTRGAGVPWDVRSAPFPVPAVDSGGRQPLDAPMWPLAVLAAAVVVLVAVAAGWHAVWLTGAVFCAMALLGGAALEVRAGPFALDLGVAGDVLVGASIGVAAGFVASLLVAGGRYWHRRWT